MMHFFMGGGVVMWPLAAIAAGIVYLAVRAAAGIRRGSMPPASIRRDMDGILFWGGMSVLLGFLGTVMGVVVMARATALAGGAEPTLLWGGFGMTLHSLIFGVALFLLAATLWFLLRRGLVES